VFDGPASWSTEPAALEMNANIAKVLAIGPREISHTRKVTRKAAAAAFVYAHVAHRRERRSKYYQALAIVFTLFQAWRVAISGHPAAEVMKPAASRRDNLDLDHRSRQKRFFSFSSD
jgi:hypothetical protein